MPNRRKQNVGTGDKPFGIYDDDGNEINADLIAKPSLCVSCKKDEDPLEEMLCFLNRADQQGEPEFRCDAYEPKAP
jgi:hypothetical protein